MRGFFKGWRRRVGCITLMMACALGSGWIRSLSSWDLVAFPIGKRTHQLTSYRGGIAWSSWDSVKPGWAFETDMKPLDRTFEEHVAGWSSRYFKSWKMTVWSAYYWHFMIPLTLVSFILLLWPSRRSKTNATSRN
jgi:hypothetical protein